MNKNLLLTGTLILILSCLQMAKGQLSLSAEIRPRTELRNGFKRPIERNTDPALFTEQRTRINLAYQRDKIGIKLSFQDIRIWGAASQIYKSDPALTNFYEAWASYDFSNQLTLRLGRQALDYDNARLLGNLDWAQQGRSHDLALLMLKSSNNFQVHAGAAFNQDSFQPEYQKLAGTYFQGVQNYKTMQFLWANKVFAKGNLSFLFINSGNQSGIDSVFFSQTSGFYFTRPLASLTFTAEAFYQFGKDQNGNTRNAYLAAFNLSAFSKNKISLGLGLDLLSGNNSSTAANEAFDPLYGTHHKFYGLMDYFYVGNGHSNRGLVDLHLNASIKLRPAMSLMAQVHNFYSDSKVIYPSENQRKKSLLGYELDLVYKWKIAAEATLTSGYSQFLQTNNLEMIKGNAEAQAFNCWAWAMIAITPDLLNK